MLLVEDDPSICRLVELQLRHRKMDVRCAYDGPSGVKEVDNYRPDVVILDVMLPIMDGVGVLKQLRREGNKVPVIMLTARDSALDKIHSLDLGADDYLTKPFDMGELLARLRVLVRRTQVDEVIRIADLEIDTAAREVRRAEWTIELTNREYELLEFMAQNPRRVLSRDLLLERVWGRELDLETNVVDVYIGYLRKKIDGSGGAPLIRTVRGAGYTIREG